MESLAGLTGRKLYKVGIELRSTKSFLNIGYDYTAAVTIILKKCLLGTY